MEDDTDLWREQEEAAEAYDGSMSPVITQDIQREDLELEIVNEGEDYERLVSIISIIPCTSMWIHLTDKFKFHSLIHVVKSSKENHLPLPNPHSPPQHQQKQQQQDHQRPPTKPKPHSSTKRPATWKKTKKSLMKKLWSRPCPRRICGRISTGRGSLGISIVCILGTNGTSIIRRTMILIIRHPR
jgi:hypothetical protein